MRSRTGVTVKISTKHSQTNRPPRGPGAYAFCERCKTARRPAELVTIKQDTTLRRTLSYRVCAAEAGCKERCAATEHARAERAAAFPPQVSDLY